MSWPRWTNSEDVIVKWPLALIHLLYVVTCFKTYHEEYIREEKLMQSVVFPVVVVSNDVFQSVLFLLSVWQRTVKVVEREGAWSTQQSFF